MNLTIPHDDERYQRLRELVDRAADRPASEWAAFLERECATDPTLKGEAMRLLEHVRAASAERFLELPTSPAETSSAPVTCPEPEQTGAELAFVGKYQIERRFSEASGQAAAYLAFDPDLERHVVLKRYHGGPADRPGEAEEGQALARVDSPYVAPCYGVERVDDAAYLVVKYVPGRNLAEVRRDGPLGIAQVVSILSQLAEGVAAVHAQGLIHRDIKPANVILHDNGTPRLVDFGLATYLGSSRLRERCGSPPYMAPEQARAESDRINCRTDIFGLGGVLYFLLTGHAPFEGRDPCEVLWRACRNDFDRAALHASGIPPHLAQLVERAMAPEPQDRPDAAAFALELKRFAARPRQRRRAGGAAGPGGPGPALAPQERWGDGPRRPGAAADRGHGDPAATPGAGAAGPDRGRVPGRPGRG